MDLVKIHVFRPRFLFFFGFAKKTLILRFFSVLRINPFSPKSISVLQRANRIGLTVSVPLFDSPDVIKYYQGSGVQQIHVIFFFILLIPK